MRRLPEETYRSVKTATRLLREELGGVDAMAACTRAVRSLVSDYGNPHSDRFMPADVILDCESVAGAPLITAALARAQGCALVPVGARGAGELAAQLAEIGRDVSALFATAATALGHGRPTAAERAQLLAELDEVARVAMETRAVLQAEGAA